MQTTPQRPVVTVLCASQDARLPLLEAHVEPLRDRIELRFTDADGLADAVRGARALFLWDFFSTAVRDVWSAATDVEWIHVAAAGVDKLLFDELTESDVVVTNARGAFDRPIAEFVLASILARAKLVHESYELQQQRTWRHRETRLVQGDRVMIVGTGAIGRETGRLLSAVGLEVRAAGRTARSGDPDFGEVVASAELADHVGDVDHLVVTAPLTEETRGLVGAEVLAALPTNAHVINVGRGPIVDEQALLGALTSGEIAGASLDTFDTEPLPRDNPLWTAPGVVISAHMSGDVHGWLDTLARQFVDNAERWLAGEPLHNVVDKRLGFVAEPATEVDR